MEISSTEIDILSRRINNSISGYSLSGAYSIEHGMLLRLRHESKQELMIAISSFAPWITTKNLTLARAEDFVTRVRDSIERSKLQNVKQAGKERITEFSFLSKDGSIFSLFAEFFGGGNLILVDGDGVIVDAARSHRFRHRSIELGEKYSLPPSRGVALSELTVEALERMIEQPGEDLGLPAIKWFGRHVSTSRKFVEEVFHEAGVEPNLPSKTLSREQLGYLAKASQDLRNRLESSTTGYLLLPGGESDLDVDVCSFLPYEWVRLKNENIASIQEFRELGEALDEAQVQSLLLARKQKASDDTRARAAELGSAISKQDKLLERNSSNALSLRKLASELMSGVEEIGDNLLANLASIEVVEREGSDSGKYRFVNEPRSFASSYLTPNALASRLFDEAKRLEVKNRNISEVRADLVRRRDLLSEQSRATEERVSKRIEFERRPREWFERYRWFFTSDFRLAVGGKDSTSNSIVVNKYTNPDDLVFHADLHGSPFFILKGKQDGTDEISSAIELELAQATVGFSRAWKDELGSADAFWVRPEQVKKSAPSGEYLPRGSFFIEGKKNFVKHVKVELSLGIMDAEKFPGKSSITSEDQEKTVSKPVVVCGPYEALSAYCAAQIKIGPGREKSTAVARRAKQNLVSKVKDNRLKEAAKKLPIDEFIKVLPSGMYKLVGEKQNG